MALLATLLGCQGIDEFRTMLPAAMNFGLTPVEIKETTYQSVAYLGIGRVFPFLKAVNEFLESRGIPLPLKGRRQLPPRTAGKPVRRLRWISSARGCVTSGSRAGREPTYQLVVGWQLLWWLLHPQKFELCRAGTNHILLPCGTGWLRTSAYQSCGGKYTEWQW